MLTETVKNVLYVISLTKSSHPWHHLIPKSNKERKWLLVSVNSGSRGRGRVELPPGSYNYPWNFHGVLKRRCLERARKPCQIVLYMTGNRSSSPLNAQKGIERVPMSVLSGSRCRKRVMCVPVANTCYIYDLTCLPTHLPTSKAQNGDQSSFSKYFFSIRAQKRGHTITRVMKLLVEKLTNANENLARNVCSG